MLVYFNQNHYLDGILLRNPTHTTVKMGVVFDRVV